MTMLEFTMLEFLDRNSSTLLIAVMVIVWAVSDTIKYRGHGPRK